MKIQVTTAPFKAAPDVVFDFVSNIENLPKWATAYAKSIRRDGDDYIVDTPMGDLFQVFDVNKDAGLIDMRSGPAKDQLWTFYIRIFSDNMGGSVLNFTSLQMPGQSDEEFGGMCASLAGEMENIRQVVEG